MSGVFEIVAPLSNVNDNSVVVCEQLTEDGAMVTKGQPVVTIETSKAASELTAPADGIIRYVVNVLDEVPNGTVLALVGENPADIDAYIKETAENNRVSAKSETAVSAGEPERTAGKNRSGKDEDTPFGVFENTVTLGEIMVRDGETAEAGRLLARVRSSSGVEEIKAPVSGYVFWDVMPYEIIQAGEAAGVISGSGVRKASFGRTGRKKDRNYTSLRISAAAGRLLDEYDTSAQALGLSGLITARDVLRCVKSEGHYDGGDNHAGEAYPRGTHKDKVKKPVVHQTTGGYEKLSKAKRSEAAFLSEANSEAVVSRVSVLVPTRGIFSACSEDPELAGRFSSILIMETAALLKKYPMLQSVYDDGNVFVYDQINVGYAVSIDEGLKVPVFHKCDGLSLDEIAALKEEYIEKYVDKTLSADDLSGGTFTITDMSQSGCFMFDPVLNLGQSAILGVGGENTAHTEYPLILAFDHRVCDGMSAAAFLNDLRTRLVAYENALMPEPDKDEDQSEREAYCDYCFRDAQELEKKGHYLFKSVDKNGQEKYICSICAAGY